MNKKELASVLHMYYGCYIYNYHTKKLTLLNHHSHSSIINNDKMVLVLRDISTLTDAESIGASVRGADAIQTKNSIYKSMAVQVKYLCSRGIDLFDLIKNNAAVNVNTLKINNPYTHSKATNLKKYNGICIKGKYEGCTMYVAAKSDVQAANLVSMAMYGKDGLISTHYIKTSYNKGAWGTRMKDVVPITPCVYVIDKTQQIIKLI